MTEQFFFLTVNLQGHPPRLRRALIPEMTVSSMDSRFVRIPNTAPGFWKTADTSVDSVLVSVILTLN